MHAVTCTSTQGNRASFNFSFSFFALPSLSILLAMPTTPHLDILAPSSTTVEYVVSSKRKPASRALQVLRHVLRIIIIAHLVLLDLMKAQMCEILDNSTITFFQRFSLLQPLLRLVAANADWWTLGMANTVIVFVCLRRSYNGANMTAISFRVPDSHYIRRITSSPPRHGHTNFDRVTILLLEPYNYFHTHDQNSRYCYP